MAKLTISRSRVLAVISHAGWKSGDKWDNDRLLSKISQLPEVLDDSKASPKDPQVAKDIASLLKQVSAGGAIEVVDDEPEEPAKTTTKAKPAAAKPVAKTKAKPSVAETADEDEGDGDDDEPEEEDEDDGDIDDDDELDGDWPDEDEEDDAVEDEEEEEEDDDDDFDSEEDDEDDDDEDEDVVASAVPSKEKEKSQAKAAKRARAGKAEPVTNSRIASKGDDATPPTLPCSIEQTSPEPGVVEIVIRVRTGAAATALAPIEVSEPPPPVVAKKVRTVPVDDEGKTLTDAPAKKTVAKSTRWHQAARTLKAAGIDSEITDKLVNKVDSAYGRSNPRESRVCLVGAQAAIKSYIGGEVDASLSYSVAGAVVRKYGPKANDEKGHVLFVKLLGKPCETASHYLKNALWVIEAYRTA